jgi:hypothetical protein
MSFTGWEPRILRGDRGEREGKYLVMIVIESVEMRDRLFPGLNQVSEEGQRFFASFPEFGKVAEKWRKLATFPGDDTTHTDYVVATG